MAENQISVLVGEAPPGTFCKPCGKPASARLQRLDHADDDILLCSACFERFKDFTSDKALGVTQYKDEAMDW